MNGVMPEMILLTFSPSVEDATKMSSPKGGVIIPIQVLRQTMMPKWMGSIPKLCATGNSAGHEEQQVDDEQEDDPIGVYRLQKSDDHGGQLGERDEIGHD